MSDGEKERDVRAALRFVPYISDNPYRLLSLGSSTSQTELRVAANGVKQKTAVGITLRAGLDDLFGSEELGHCSDIVYSIANNPEKRTAFRLFWPFHATGPGHRLCGNSNSEFFHSDTVTEYEGTHLEFLNAWYRFLVQSDAGDLSKSFHLFHDLYEDEECDSFLSDLLEKEGVPDPIGVLYAGQENAIECLLILSCQRAVRFWESDNVDEAIALMEAVCHSPFDDKMIDRVMRNEIRPLGERETRNLEAAIEGLQCLEGEFDISTITITAKTLRQLAGVLVDRVPNARHWLTTVQEQVDQVAYAGVQHAKRIAFESGDYSRAKALLMEIQELDVSADTRQSIDDELSFMAKCDTQSQTKGKSKQASPGGRLCEVVVTTDRIRVPPTCTCCLGLADREHAVSGTWTDYHVFSRTTHTISFDFPICSRCKNHADQLSSRTTALVLCALVPSLMVTWLFKALWPSVPYLLYAVTGLVISTGLMVLLAKRIGVDELDPCHATRSVPVQSVGASPRWMRLRFWNAEYARALAEANQCHLEVTQATRCSYGQSLLLGATRGTVIAWNLILTFIVSGVIFSCLGSTSGSSNYAAPNDIREDSSVGNSTDSQQAAKEVRRARLRSEHAALVEKLKRVDQELEASKVELELTKEKLKHRQEDIELQRQSLDHTDELAVQSFNETVDDYNRERQEFDAQVSEYNQRVASAKKDVARARQIEAALTEMGDTYE